MRVDLYEGCLPPPLGTDGRKLSFQFYVHNSLSTTENKGQISPLEMYKGCQLQYISIFDRWTEIKRFR
jgi:hypothetical protein